VLDGDGFCGCQWVTAFMCIDGDNLGDGFCSASVAMAFMCIGRQQRATALLRGVARGNFSDSGMKLRRDKLCAGSYLRSKVGCHVGWRHVTAGLSLTETGQMLDV
jgi:hypothetical protein